jgi:hypothetical protein
VIRPGKRPTRESPNKQVCLNLRLVVGLFRLSALAEDARNRLKTEGVAGRSSRAGHATAFSPPDRDRKRGSSASSCIEPEITGRLVLHAEVVGLADQDLCLGQLPQYLQAIAPRRPVNAGSA